MILKNTAELEDSKRRKVATFSGRISQNPHFRGNPPYDPNNRKDKYMSSKYIEKHIKFTEEQYAIVSQKAAELGLRTGAYVKQMAIQGKLIRYDLAELREVTRPFRMIGNELNQIAKRRMKRAKSQLKWLKRSENSMRNWNGYLRNISSH